MTSTNVPDSLLQSPLFQLERLRRRTRDEVDQALVQHNTSVREYWVLSCLVAEKAASQSALSATLGIDASDMVRLLDALERHSWVKRERDPNDRRRQVVTATKKGRKAAAELEQVVSGAEDTALDESSDKQLKHLRKLAIAVSVPEST